MSGTTVGVEPAGRATTRRIAVARAVIPLAVGAVIALWPAPDGLSPAACATSRSSQRSSPESSSNDPGGGGGARRLVVAGSLRGTESPETPRLGTQRILKRNGVAVFADYVFVGVRRERSWAPHRAETDKDSVVARSLG